MTKLMTALATEVISAGLALFTLTLMTHPHDLDMLATVCIMIENFTWRRFLEVQFLEIPDRGDRSCQVITDVASTPFDFGSSLGHNYRSNHNYTSNHSYRSNCKHSFGDRREPNYKYRSWT
jgi:hypothetical protein